VASTIFVLRRRAGTQGYAMPGYPFLPLLYIACLLGVAGRDFSQEPILSVAGVAILLTGWPLFKLGHRLYHRP
jgi:basic amino acid/polyamine antiporter, APA family